MGLGLSSKNLDVVDGRRSELEDLDAFMLVRNGGGRSGKGLIEQFEFETFEFEVCFLATSFLFQ